MYQSRANSVRKSASTIACTTNSRRRLFCEALGRMRTAAMGQYASSAGRVRSNNAISPGSSSGVITTSQSRAMQMTCIISPVGQGVVAEHDAGEREHRGGHERAHGHGGQPGQRAASSVGAHPAGEHGDQHEGERPAAGHVVGGRGEVEQQTGEEPDRGAERGATGDGGGHHDDQGEVGHHAVDREQAEHRGLQGHGEHDEEGHEADARDVHWVSP